MAQPQQENPKTLLFGEWLPDWPTLNVPNNGITVARNVVPLTQASYGPLPQFQSIGYAALPSTPFGFMSFLDATGNTHLFTGTATKLYHFVTGGGAFADVTKVAATYAASIDNPWRFTAMGNTIIATDGADAMQAFTIGATNYVDLSGSAPIARIITTVKDFVVVADTIESATSFRQRVHWSAIGDPTNWPALGGTTAAQLQSDAQDLRADLGYCRAIASNIQSADMVVFMDRGVYSAWYVGSPAVFNFQIAQGATGCMLPNTVVVNHGYCYYLGTDGFWAFDGVTPRAIGAEKINKWFFSDPQDGVNSGFMDRVQGAADPVLPLVYWIYCGPGSTGTCNRMLIYNWQINQWSMARLDSKQMVWLGKGLSAGYSLDQLDSFGTIDSLPASLDSPLWQGGSPILMGFDSAFNLCTLNSSNMTATIETSEIEPNPGWRTRATNSRPLCDGGIPAISLGTRNRLQDAVTYTTATSMNTYGECNQRIDARYMLAQLTIPGMSIWTEAEGIALDSTRSTRW